MFTRDLPLTETVLSYRTTRSYAPVTLSRPLQGDEITVIRQLDGNWLEGRCAGVQGIFPISYVDIINAPQTPLMTPMTTPLGSYACTPDYGLYALRSASPPRPSHPAKIERPLSPGIFVEQSMLFSDSILLSSHHKKLYSS